MANINNQFNRYPNLTPEELEIIEYFAKGQKHSISSQTLKLECSETSIRLVSNQGKLIGISKQTNEWQRKVLINTNSTYTSSIVELLTDCGFITKHKSSHPDFTEHHYYQVPSGYKLNHTDILQLWKVWWNNKRYQLNARNLPIDVLVFSKGNWCPIQDLQPKQGNFLLKTNRGELTISAEDLVVWIDKADPKTVTASQPLPPVTKQVEIESPRPNQMPTDITSEANTPTEVLPIPTSPITQVSPPINAPPIDRAEQKIDELADAEDLDLESYLNTFNTEDTEDIDRIEGIYNIHELLNGTVGESEVSPPPAPPKKPTFQLEVTVVEPPASIQPQVATAVPAPTSPKRSIAAPVEVQIPVSIPKPNQRPPASIADRKHSLKLKAVNTLTNYLQDGDAVTHTEVLKNGRGQVMNRKVTTIRRGCPGWTIEQIKKLEDELAEL